MKFETYKKYIGAVTNNKNSVIGAIENSSLQLVNSKFKQDIGYRNAVVYSKYDEDEQPIKIDIRVARYGSDSKGLGLRNVYYKPGTNIYIGDILTFDGDNWLIVDHYYDNFAPRSIVHLCNNKLDLLDDNGDEIFYPCVLENKITRYQEIDTYNRYIPLPDDVLMCIVSYNSNTSKIKHRDRFVFKDTNPKRTWEVQAYDNIAYVREGHGVVYLTLKQVPQNENEIPEDQEEVNKDGWW